MAAWIEIVYKGAEYDEFLVAARVAAWIEINTLTFMKDTYTSPPVWRRGLKSYEKVVISQSMSRRPCGGVD